MKKIMFLLVLSASLGYYGMSNAQLEKGKFGAGVLLGGSQLKGDIKKSNTNFTGGLILRFRPIPFFALTATSTYGKMVSGLNALKTEVINGSLSGNLFFFPSKQFSPLLTFGLSGLHFQTTDGDDRQLLRANGSPLSGWETAFQLGVGMEFFVGNQWAINTKAEYYFTRGDELDAIVEGKNDGFFQGLVGVLHYFKKPKKVKYEETNDKKIQMSDVEKSLAPKKPMSSQDMIKNIERVVGVPTDKASDFQEENQVTAPSSQPIQSYPTLSEKSEKTVSPAIKQEQDIKASDNEERTANGIYFESRSAKILEKSKQQLQKIYKYLRENPEIEIELQGFKDDQNKNEFDRNLAYERAKAVKTYLVNLGIQPNRILINTEP
jgi:outer membrane protein OmpA-like peptidoglycan-associated protein/opacity protein-like surface antigen